MRKIMKIILTTKLYILFLITTIFILPVSIYSQNTSLDKEIVVKTREIQKILAHQLGYKVLYRKSNSEMASFYIPNSWFIEGRKKAQMIRGNEREYPYFQIIWVGGKFYRVRLFVNRGAGHSSWGTLNESSDSNNNFDVEEIKPNL